VPKYVFLDRDGVINRRISDGYVTTWEQFQFLPRVLDALRLLTERGYRLIVVSNQACVSKGLMSGEALDEITLRFVDEVKKNGGNIERVYYCPHQDQDGCECRKPKPGLLLQAQREHQLVFPDTYLVGDSPRDLMAARQVGCPAILVGTGQTNVDAHEWTMRSEAIVPDLYRAAEFILAREGQSRNRFPEETPASASHLPTHPLT
jgi:D-glycero-D-manno-heptose 1,7-bisphosphate phosphatase